MVCMDDSTITVSRLNVEHYGLHTFLKCAHYLPPVQFEVQDFVRIPFTPYSWTRKFLFINYTVCAIFISHFMPENINPLV